MAFNRLNTLDQLLDISGSLTPSSSMNLANEPLGVGRAISGSNGASATITVGGTVVITGLTGMTQAAEGNFLRISGSVSPSNNGYFLITNYLSATSVEISNGSAVSGGPVSWEQHYFYSLEDDLNYERTDRAAIKGVAYSAAIPTYVAVTATSTQIPANLSNIAGKTTDAKAFVVNRNFEHQSVSTSNTFVTLVSAGNLRHATAINITGVPISDGADSGNPNATFVEIIDGYTGSGLYVLNGINLGNRIFGRTRAGGSTSPNSVEVEFRSVPEGDDISSGTAYTWEAGQPSSVDMYYGWRDSILALNENSFRVTQVNGQVSSGPGDVVGPGSATDNAISRYNGSTGKLIQNSSVTISDNGVITIDPAILLPPFILGPNAQGQLVVGLNADLIDGYTYSDIIITLENYAVPVNRLLTAGAGLTGGGNLSADRTFDVVANADGSIIVNANDIQIGVLANNTQHGVRGNGNLHSVSDGSNAGFMSSSDFTKLAGISSGATNTPLTSADPINVNKSIAAVGVATTAARSDHKHNIDTSSAVTLSVGGSNAEGSSTNLSRADHTHAIPAFGSTVGTFTQGNDSRLSDDRTASGLRSLTTVIVVSGAVPPTSGQALVATSATAANWQSVAALTATSPVNITKSAAIVGVATTAARADHKHDVDTAAAVTLSVGGSNAEGSSANLSRADHTHAIPAFGSTVGTFAQGNDSRLTDDRTASGLRSLTTVIVVSGATAPTSGQALVATSGTAANWQSVAALTATSPVNITKSAAVIGVATTAARADHKHDVDTAAAVTLSVGGSNAEGSSTNLSRADHTHALPAFGTTAGTFAEGNDSRLSDDRTASGLRSLTTVIVVSGATAPTSGQALVATSGTAATWQSVAALTATAPVNITKSAAVIGVATTAARADHKHDVDTAAAVTLSVGGSNAEGASTSLSRADHTHAIPAFGSTVGTFTQGNDSRLSDDRTASGLRSSSTVINVSSAIAPTSGQALIATSGTTATWQSLTALTATDPTNVSKSVAVVGVAITAARSDHKHDIDTAVAVTLSVGGSNAEGASANLSRADHTHALPAFGTTAGTFAQGNDSRLSDDRTASGLRSLTTVIVVSGATAPTSGQALVATSGTAATWQSVAALTATAPVNITKSAAVIGVATTAARADHKHDVDTAVAVTLSVGGSNAEGASTSLSRADHTHALPAFGTTAGTFAEGNDSRLTDDRVASGLRSLTTVIVVSGATAPTSGQALVATSGTAATWQDVSALTANAPINITKSVAVVGVAITAARADHKHDVDTAVAVTLSVGGSNAEGASTSLSRADHTHALPAFGTTVGTFAQGNDSRLSDDRTASGLRSLTTVIVVSGAAAPTSGQALVATSGTAATWQSVAALTATAPVNITKSAAVIGVATTAARADHKHDVDTAVAVTLSVGGSNAEGASTSLSRADHTHALPAFGTTAGTFAEGNDSRLSDDRTASGLRSSSTVVSVSGAAAPTSGQALVATSGTAATWQSVSTLTATAPVNITKSAAVVGVATTAARSDHKHDVDTAVAVTLSVGGSNAEGSSTNLSRADHTHALPAFGTTAGTFAEGNDSRLSDDRTASGLRSSSTVINVSSATAPTSGQALVATSGTAATWQSVAALTATSPVNITKSAAVVGVATTAARADHKHDVDTAAAVTLSVGGSNAEGASTSLSRADHTHALPAFGTTAGTFAEGNDSRLSDDRIASGLRSSSTVVSVSGAAAPTPGQALIATSGTVATWQTLSGASIVKGTSVINFGSYPGQSNLEFIVTGQTTITAASRIVVRLSTIATADHTSDHHIIASLCTSLQARTIVNSVGFTIVAISQIPLTGSFNVLWEYQ